MKKTKKTIQDLINDEMRFINSRLDEIERIQYKGSSWSNLKHSFVFSHDFTRFILTLSGAAYVILEIIKLNQ